jgi:hypothetical protein
MQENANPGGGQVPQHRFQEVLENQRKLEQQNQQLRQTLDAMMLRQNPQQPVAEEKPLFQPEVDQALEKKIKAMLEPETAKLKTHMGYLVDRNDELEFRQKWGSDAFEKNKEKIDAIREEATRRGQFIKREDAYKHVYFEENSKKPQPKPEAPKGPTYDPYTQKYVQEPVAQEPAPVVPNPVTPVTLTPPVEPQTDIVLPPVGPMNTPSAAQPRAATGIDLNTDDKVLDTWATKYGDQPL